VQETAERKKFRGDENKKIADLKRKTRQNRRCKTVLKACLGLRKFPEPADVESATIAAVTLLLREYDLMRKNIKK
jgi:hypothetical protein